MIVVQNLHLRLPGFALRDINLRAYPGDCLILVGPSGSGKTLLLETIAGLHRAASGTIRIDGKDITAFEPERRNIGMVYQDCALFPHLTVAQNITFGLEVRGKPVSWISRELDRVVQLLDIAHLLPRMPAGLSGGEKQKVALARALIIRPDVLLLDESLTALDPQSRESVRQEIARLHSELGITMVYVTHDFEEAVSIGTRVAVVGGGEIKQVGSPDEIFRQPNSEFVARFTMAMNIIRGVARKGNGAGAVFEASGLALQTCSGISGKCCAAIRPENILVSLSGPQDNPTNVFGATVKGIVNRGSVVNVIADLPPRLTCLLTRHAFDKLNLRVGRKVYIEIPSSGVSLFRG